MNKSKNKNKHTKLQKNKIKELILLFKNNIYLNSIL